MPIEYRKDQAFFRNEVSVEEAETLLEWLQANPAAEVDLSQCSHMHTANLQVLMSAKRAILHWPANPDLCAWLEPALSCGD